MKQKEKIALMKSAMRFTNFSVDESLLVRILKLERLVEKKGDKTTLKDLCKL